MRYEAKCTGADHDRHERWYCLTYRDSFPQTRKEPHGSLPPSVLHCHVLRKRDLLDYRRLMPLRDSPRWGEFAIRKYCVARAEGTNVAPGTIYAAVRNVATSETELTRHS
jgi:hypothetical protein